MPSLLNFLIEGQVYEVLLVTRGNVAPIGIVRKGPGLHFRLFGGRSAEEIREHPHVSIQFTNDAGLIVRLALNVPPAEKLEFVESGKYRWIKGLPGLYGDVEWEMREHSDEIGTAMVLEGVITPLGEIEGSLPPRPMSRADCALIEMAVDFTRLRAAKGKKARELHTRMLASYRLYRRLGGRDWIAKKMVEWASELGLSEELKEIK
ncbi:DUF447 domain-containing protein [Thermococcus sp. AM4]|uniref:DUF447 domain-containing protein n=1 Tax=Thermococcus sp. (strain AM4) TaxID=246969 RepID=UPI0002299392|nr:DUF447 domain-containing protein [Thermococcus sp. AM4]AEO13947.1 hypothetical protein TAM4_2349 [Thermococcus sp. AM4]